MDHEDLEHKQRHQLLRDVAEACTEGDWKNHKCKNRLDELYDGTPESSANLVPSHVAV